MSNAIRPFMICALALAALAPACGDDDDGDARGDGGDPRADGSVHGDAAVSTSSGVRGGRRDGGGGSGGSGSAGTRAGGGGADAATEPAQTGPCGPNSLAAADGKCRNCGDCAALMQAGLSTGNVFQGADPFTDQQHCMCEALEGVFGSDGESVTLARCDADGDGWISESARVALGIDDKGAPRANADPALRANARCKPRIIDRVILHTDGSAFAPEGSSHTVMLEQPLVLAESDSNDDDAKLAARLDAYGAGTEGFSAAELNGLTKACSPGDHNHNGLEDVDEWDMKKNLSASPLEERLQAFGYFVELSYGWYEAPASSSGAGAYHIAERARSAANGEAAIALGYLPADGSDYSRSCIRRTDSSTDTLDQPNQGFARAWTSSSAASAAGFAGLHSSQFKCMKVISKAPDQGPTVHLVTADKLSAFPLRWNECKLGEPAAGTGDANPALSQFTCSAVDNPGLNAGAVAWAAVRYNHKDSLDDGIGLRPGRSGCIEECEKNERANLGCAGEDCEALRVPPSVEGAVCTPASEDCRGSTSEFGKLLCGCAPFRCDADGDGFYGETSVQGYACGGEAAPSEACAVRWVPEDPAKGEDCDDAAPAVYKGRREICNGIDDDCDKTVDNTGLLEICNSVDDDCDGMIDTNLTDLGPCTNGQVGACGVGESRCAQGVLSCVAPGPTREKCHDNVDNDCNGMVDEQNAEGCEWYGYDADHDMMTWFNTCECGPSDGRVPSSAKLDPNDCVQPSSEPHEQAMPVCVGVASSASFDWDHSGTVQLESPAIGGAHFPCSTCGCTVAPGWLGAVAACGVTAEYVDGCYNNGFGGEYTYHNPKQQRCM